MGEWGGRGGDAQGSANPRGRKLEESARLALTCVRLWLTLQIQTLAMNRIYGRYDCGGFVYIDFTPESADRTDGLDQGFTIGVT